MGDEIEAQRPSEDCQGSIKLIPSESGGIEGLPRAEVRTAFRRAGCSS